MSELYYRPVDIAVLLSTWRLPCKVGFAVIDTIWDKDYSFISEKYSSSKRKFVLETLYWTNYLYNKNVLDTEFPAIQKELKGSNLQIIGSQYTQDFSELELFFKQVRIRLVVNQSNSYVRYKLRTILKHYKKKRRSSQFIAYFEECISLYGLEITLKGRKPCNFKDLPLDHSLFFRLTNTP